ncbi:MAG: DUF5652 family protein [bacterium]|nr:DUF5652 family protein [bacterium]
MIGDIPETIFILALVLAIWTLPWKGFALWRAAHRGDKWWFVVFLVVNTAGIFEILYLLVTRTKKQKKSINVSEPPTGI